jgi:hypothetical protein
MKAVKENLFPIILWSLVGIMIFVLLCIGMTPAADITKGLTGKQDVSLWDGSTTRTFTKDTTGGYTLTFNQVDWPGVDVLMKYGGGVNRNATTLASALTGQGTTAKAAFWLSPGDWTIDSDTTITSNALLDIPSGVTIIINTGKTLTINGPISAGLYKIFVVNGTLTLGDLVGTVYPHWWGADPNETAANNKTAFDAAIASGKVLDLKGGAFTINGLASATVVKLISTGQDASLDNAQSTGDTITLSADSTLRIENVSLGSTGATTGRAIYADGACRYPLVRDANITGHKFGFRFNDPIQGTFEHLYMAGQGSGVAGGVGIHLGGGTTVTIKDVYVTVYETDIVNAGEANLFIRPIMESCVTGFQSHTRFTMLQPYFSGVTNYDLSLGNASGSVGGVIIGYKESASNKVQYFDATTRQRTTLFKDDDSTGAKLFGRGWSYGAAAPTTGAHNVGDTHLNSSGVTAQAIGWVCVEAGTPGVWKPLSYTELDRFGGDISTTGASNSELRTITLPANSLGANGGLRLTYMFQTTGAGGNKTMHLHVGSGATVTTHPADATATEWLTEVIIQNQATNVNRIWFKTFQSDDGTLDAAGYSSKSVDTTAAVVLTLVGVCADAGDNIALLNFSAERF